MLTPPAIAPGLPDPTMRVRIAGIAGGEKERRPEHDAAGK